MTVSTDINAFKEYCKNETYAIMSVDERHKMFNYTFSDAKDDIINIFKDFSDYIILDSNSQTYLFTNAEHDEEKNLIAHDTYILYECFRNLGFVNYYERIKDSDIYENVTNDTNSKSLLYAMSAVSEYIELLDVNQHQLHLLRPEFIEEEYNIFKEVRKEYITKHNIRAINYNEICLKELYYGFLHMDEGFYYRLYCNRDTTADVHKVMATAYTFFNDHSKIECYGRINSNKIIQSITKEAVFTQDLDAYISNRTDMETYKNNIISFINTMLRSTKGGEITRCAERCAANIRQLFNIKDNNTINSKLLNCKTAENLRSIILSYLNAPPTQQQQVQPQQQPPPAQQQQVQRSQMNDQDLIKNVEDNISRNRKSIESVVKALNDGEYAIYLKPINGLFLKRVTFSINDLKQCVVKNKSTSKKASDEDVAATSRNILDKFIEKLNAPPAQQEQPQQQPPPAQQQQPPPAQQQQPPPAQQQQVQQDQPADLETSIMRTIELIKPYKMIGNLIKSSHTNYNDNNINSTLGRINSSVKKAYTSITVDELKQCVRNTNSSKDNASNEDVDATLTEIIRTIANKVRNAQQ